MPDSNKKRNRNEERIREIDLRVEELDALLANTFKHLITNDLSSPSISTEGEMQYWADRRDPRAHSTRFRGEILYHPNNASALLTLGDCAIVWCSLDEASLLIQLCRF